MKKIFVLLVLVLIFIEGYSQNYLNIRYELDSIHQIPHTSFYSFQEKNDTLYIIGERKENINNIFFYRSFLLMLDDLGNIIRYAETDYFVRYGSLIFTFNNNLAFAGSNYQGNLTLFNYSTQLDSLWVKYLNFSTPNVNLEGRNLIETSDNHFVILGKQYDYNNGTSKEYVIKTDSLGNEIWRRDYIMPSGQGYWTTPNVIFETNDSNYMALQTIRRDSPSFSLYEEQTSIEKIDTSGNKLWEYKTDNNRLIVANDGLPTDDDGLIFCGTEGQKVWAGVFYQGHIRKINSSRQVEWEMTIGNSEGSYFHDIEKLADGNYLASGIDILTYPDTALVNYSDSIHEAGWLLKFTPNGTILWERHFMKTYGIPMAHIINETHELSNGDLISVGHMFTTLSTHAGYWGWLIRTDSFGCIVPDCQLLDNTENISVIFDNEVTVFPNPASEMVKFRFEKPIEGQTEIRVYSGLGQLVGQTASPLPQTETQMNVSDWNNGMYYYGVYIEGQLVKQGQILIQN